MRYAFALFGLTVALHAAPARVLSVVEPEAALNRTLTLRVDGDVGDCNKLVLFIQRSPIYGLAARCSAGKVAFTLAVNDKNADKWHRILGGHFFKRVVAVGLGPNDTMPFETRVDAQPFDVIQPWRAAAIVLFTILLSAALIAVRRYTSTLDSMARIQIVVWLVVIIMSYIYIWTITGEMETINSTALALLAIGAGTAAGAAIISGKKTVDVKTVVQTLANASPEDFTPIEISGPTGLHAVMIATWTAVLAIVFAATVWRTLEMPEFTTEVLAILGISGGTYLAFSMTRQH